MKVCIECMAAWEDDLSHSDDNVDDRHVDEECICEDCGSYHPHPEVAS